MPIFQTQRWELGGLWATWQWVFGPTCPAKKWLFTHQHGCAPDFVTSLKLERCAGFSTCSIVNLDYRYAFFAIQRSNVLLGCITTRKCLVPTWMHWTSVGERLFIHAVESTWRNPRAKWTWKTLWYTDMLHMAKFTFFPMIIHLRVSINGGTPKAGLFHEGKSHLEMDDLGVPLF